MKIADVEKKLIDEGFSDELFEEFKMSLRRVPKSNRSQHCYITAYSLYAKQKDTEGALKIIECGALFLDDAHWIDSMRLHLNLGIIYLGAKQYQNAKEAFERAFEAVPEDKKASYEAHISLDILIAELHCANFQYTDRIKELFISICKADEFEAGFARHIFYRSVAGMIIAEHENLIDDFKVLYGIASRIIDGEHRGFVDKILKRHRCANSAGATKEALTYLDVAKKHI